MAERWPLRVSFSDVVVAFLILWSAGQTMYLLYADGTASLFVFLIPALAAAFALRGMHTLKTTGSSVLLWCVIGALIGLGMLAIFSIGLGLLFDAAVLIVYTIFRARHLGVPVVDRWGLVAEIIGFFVVPFVLFLIF
jgi:hypothetical protein